jgi:hypothetical protein
MTPTMLGPLERANLSHWAKPKHPVLPSVLHHHENTLESIYIILINYLSQFPLRTEQEVLFAAPISRSVTSHSLLYVRYGSM